MKDGDRVIRVGWVTSSWVMDYEIPPDRSVIVNHGEFPWLILRDSTGELARWNVNFLAYIHIEQKMADLPEGQNEGGKD